MIDQTTPGQTNILHQIREGMAVYDSERNHIGGIEAVVFGAGSETEVASGAAPAKDPLPFDPSANTVVESLADVFDPDDNIPEVLANRLRHHGFIKIDGGWFGADRYVMPEQISSVKGDDVHLNTKKERLVKE